MLDLLIMIVLGWVFFIGCVCVIGWFVLGVVGAICDTSKPTAPVVPAAPAAPVKQHPKRIAARELRRINHAKPTDSVLPFPTFRRRMFRFWARVVLPCKAQVA